mmetsp:Transcript_86905/g.153672  ORF Transcript_86905/g.153672 Transcript_86905/m.153672 type:complete len:167 (+) Transcript_86905:86-586(+)
MSQMQPSTSGQMFKLPPALELASPSHKVGAGMVMVYFGDRPMFDPKSLGKHQAFSRSPMKEMELTPTRTPSIRSRSSSSTKWSIKSSPDRHQLSQSFRGNFSPSSSFMLDCHGLNFQDDALKTIGGMKRTATAPGQLDALIKEGRRKNELFAGNVFKGSRNILLGA